MLCYNACSDECACCILYFCIACVSSSVASPPSRIANPSSRTNGSRGDRDIASPLLAAVLQLLAERPPRKCRIHGAPFWGKHETHPLRGLSLRSSTYRGVDTLEITPLRAGQGWVASKPCLRNIVQTVQRRSLALPRGNARDTHVDMARNLAVTLAVTATWASLLCVASAGAGPASRRPVVWGLDLGNDNM